MTDRLVHLRTSKDGGHNWSAARNRSLGEVGEFTKRVKFLRLGQSIQRVLEVSVSAACRRDLLAASLFINGKWQAFPVVGGSYADDTVPWSCQDTVNWLPVRAERPGGRSPDMLRTPPGLSLFAICGEGPIRGARNVEGRLFVVSGDTLYQVAADGTPTALGTIPGVGRCSLAHNQIEGGNEVAIGNGASGYVWNTVTETFAQITDDGFPGFLSVDFLDGYLTGIEPARRYAFHSDLAAALSYTTLDRAEAEAQPDRLMAQIVDHREWWLLGERTIEIFVNTGQSTGTFQRAGNTVIEVGCGATHSVAKLDNSVFWLGHDGIVYRANGYSPQRISTHAIEQQIRRCRRSGAFATVWEDSGHKVYYLTFPDGHTWGYDVASGEWHRKESFGLDRWRLNTLTYWNGAWIGGDYASGKLYEVVWGVCDEAGAPMVSKRVTGVLHDQQNPITIDGVEFVFDTGKDATSDPVPVLLLQPPTISGNLPDGVVGDSGTLQYTVSGGLPPYSDITVLSGSLPPGASLATDGLVTYTYTTPGSSSWTVGGTDANGTPFSVADSATIALPIIDGLFDVVTYTGTGASTFSLPTTLDLAFDGGAALTFTRSASAGTARAALSDDGATALSDDGTASMTAIGASFAGSNNGNGSGLSKGAWVFRLAEGFADVVRYVGDGTASRQIAHGLDVAPGAVFLFGAAASGFHRGAGNTKDASWTNAAVATNAALWASTDPTATHFTVGNSVGNTLGGVYAALLLAHDASPGGLIQCGTFTGNGSAAGPSVALGWEPQAVMIKRDHDFDNGWMGYDSTRNPSGVLAERGGFNTGSPGGTGFGNVVTTSDTGFQITTDHPDANGSGFVYYYIAIRSGA